MNRFLSLRFLFLNPRLKSWVDPDCYNAGLGVSCESFKKQILPIE